MALAFCLLLLPWRMALADAAPNYDESRVPAYQLPDPLVFQDGQRVKDETDWRRRRTELIDLFEEHVHGRTPTKPLASEYHVVSVDDRALGGRARKKTVRIDFAGGGPGRRMEIAIILPKSGPPAPLFLGLHLFGKSADHPLPGARILPDTLPIPDDIDPRLLPGKDTIFTILDRGYAIATIDADDLAPDDAKRYLDGIIPLFWQEGQKARAKNEWGAIGAWAWGLSRAVDYMSTDPDIDAKRIIAIGHSRRGKTALWAGARDERLAMVISNDSGCGGAALSRRRFGETVELINRRFPHWFCENFWSYNGREDRLPVDQHELIALIAPRPVYVASAAQDRWADPRGEFLATLGAEPVYLLLGRKGLGIKELPPLNTSVGQSMGYHIRSGNHALADLDWMMYLDFADRHLKTKR